MSLMPSCKDITEHSSDYLDRHMPWWQRANYRLHLMICVHCRRYVRQLKLTISTLGRTQEAAVPTTNEQQVHSIVAHLQTHPTKNDKS